MLDVGTNILVHPTTTGPGKFGRRLQEALRLYDINLRPGPASSVFLASSILEPHEYDFVGKMKILHRVDNTGEMYPWDGQHWTPDTKHVQYIYERADKHIFQTEWSAQQFKKFPKMFSEPKDYVVAFNGLQRRHMNFKLWDIGYKFCSICNTWNMTRMYGYLENFIPHFKAIVEAIPDFKWVIVGKVDPLLEQLRFRGLEKYIGVNIIPQAYPANLAMIRDDCDGFIHLVYQDSCPNSVVESAMYALPGIVLKNSGAAELIGDGGIILDGEITSNDLISAIKDIHDDNINYRSKVYNQACDKLDIVKIAGTYADELRKLA